MRMRFKPYARPELLACDFHAHTPLENKGRWKSLFARPQQPMHLELGCGKGGFLARLAVAHPQINYLGIDITDKVLILAKRNIDKLSGPEPPARPFGRRPGAGALPPAGHTAGNIPGRPHPEAPSPRSGLWWGCPVR